MGTCRHRVSRLRFLGAALALAAGAVGADAQTVTVDNADPEFSVLYGSWSSGVYGTPYGSDYHWALTTGAGSGAAEVEWRPDLPHAGGYQVSVWYVAGTNRADNATFVVHHAGGSTPVTVNQKINGETWFGLGTFSFEAGTGGYVTLHNDAHASVVIADAVRFASESSTAELTMAVSPAGWGTTDPPAGGPYTQYVDEVVSISATPGPGYEFDQWMVSGGAAVADPFSADTTVTMDQNKTVTAIFVEEQSVAPEFRAFWADAFHEGFKSTTQIDNMVSRAAAGNYNAIIAEVLAYQDSGTSAHGAYWNSAIVPKATDITGGIDPLAYLIQQAHANGIEVHTWLVAFRVSTSWPPANNSILSAHPEWIMVLETDMNGGPATVDGKYTLDPGSPDVQDYLSSIVDELVNNYAIDGIHWDYIRYTNDDAGYPAYSSYANSGLARFQAITGYPGTPPSTGYEPWDDFRRRGITELVRRAQTQVATKSGNPNLRHTAALITWGNAPSNFEYTSAWGKFQNWRYWMEEGYLDAAVPMTYYDEDEYPSWYRNWVDQSLVWSYDRHLFVGPGIYLNSQADSITQIEYALNAGADGVSTYSYAGTYDGGTDWGWYSYAAANVFAEPAPLPTMPWRDPAKTTQGAVYGRVTDGATGAPIDNATIKVNGFDTARTDGNGFYVVTRLPAGVSGSLVPVSAVSAGYTEVERPTVFVERAGFTEVNFGLGDWWAGDYDVDGDVDLDDYEKLWLCLTGPGSGPLAAGCDLFDFDLDADVDLFDVQLFQAASGS